MKYGDIRNWDENRSDIMPAILEKYRKPITADNLLERIPVIALSGEESSVDLICYEVLKLLIKQVNADIGQINLLPKGGGKEKVCIIKDGEPWLKEGIGLEGLDPDLGFTGEVLSTGKSIIVEDMWSSEKPNPFLKIAANLNKEYVNEIKKPVAGIIILPIKRGDDIFCTIELCRYREKKPFSPVNKDLLDGFAKKYGPLIMGYVLDIKNRSAINTAQKRLLDMSRLIACNRAVDYREAVEPYTKLSAADIVLVFFKTGSMYDSSYRLLAWAGKEIREVLLSNFILSGNSLLSYDGNAVFPVQGSVMDERLTRFYTKIEKLPGLARDEREFLLMCFRKIKSYVITPLHMLSQELGVVFLGSRHSEFWQHLHMNPFLSSYNSLLKSFLLNERAIYYLSDFSLKIHNPGFYCLGALKGAIAKFAPELFENKQISEPIKEIDKLFTELHNQGKALRWHYKNINIARWIQAYINPKIAQFPSLKISLRIKGNRGSILKSSIMASDEQLEMIFENLFTNSVRAITAHQAKDYQLLGEIKLTIRQKSGSWLIKFQDNGIPYKTVSGRGAPQIQSELKDLGGSLYINDDPYYTLLSFPVISEEKVINHES